MQAAAAAQTAAATAPLKAAVSAAAELSPPAAENVTDFPNKGLHLVEVLLVWPPMVV